MRQRLTVGSSPPPCLPPAHPRSTAATSPRARPPHHRCLGTAAAFPYRRCLPPAAAAFPRDSAFRLPSRPNHNSVLHLLPVRSATCQYCCPPWLFCAPSAFSQARSATFPFLPASRIKSASAYAAGVCGWWRSSRLCRGHPFCWEVGCWFLDF